MFPLTDLSLLFTALLIIAFLCFGLIVLVGMMICKRFVRHNCSESITRPILPTPLTSDNEAILANLVTKIDKNHEEDLKRSKGDRIERLMFGLYGFALAALGLTVSMLTMGEIIAAVVVGLMAMVFFFTGVNAYVHLKKYKDLNWHNFWGD
jgi:Flp pilus assembly protein TadB